MAPPPGGSPEIDCRALAPNPPAPSPFPVPGTASAAPSPPPPVVGDPLTVLERHETSLAGLRAGLVDLEASPSYLMLVGDEVGPSTQARVGAAPRQAADLWPLLHAVEAALGEMRSHVEANGSGGRQKAELTRLLGERWPADLRWPDGGSATTPATVPSMLSVAEALDVFRRRFDTIRAWVSEVNALFLDLLPRVDAARTTLARLDGEVQALGVPEPLIGRARAQADDIERRLVADPLALTTDGDGAQLDAAVAAAAAQVSTLRSGHDRLDADLGVAEELLAALRSLRARVQASASEAVAKVVDPGGVIRVPSTAVLDGPGGLADRLDDIVRNADASWDQRRTLVDGWLSTARKLEAQLQRAETANRAPLARRDELRGLLRAYQAKISAVGRAEDLELTALADQARVDLYTAPTDLSRAAATIEELARRLRS